MNDVFAGKHLVLGLSGGVACYKSAMLCRLLVQAGATVQVVMTEAAEQFMTAVTMQALSGRAVYTSQWDVREPNNMPHINLSREADVLVVAMGRRGAIGADCLREGQVVVDVGIHVNEEGKLCGDVRFDEAEPIVEAVTPVPGGVGTVTTSVLVGHVVDAASAQ